MRNIFSELEEVSRKLSQKTKAVDSLIVKVNEKLNGLNLVSDVWLIDSPVEAADYEDRDEEGDKCERYREVTLLGCCRPRKNWQLMIKQGTQMENYELLNSHGFDDLLSASDDIKLKAARLIHQLLDEIRTDSKSLLDDIDDLDVGQER